MNDRRSMVQALKMTPKELDFIKHGPPRIAQVNTSPTQSADLGEPQAEGDPILVAEPEAVPPEDASHFERKSRPKKERPPQTKSDQSAPLTTPVVPITIRFKQATAEALRRASLERRLGGMSPASQQEIVEIALSDWLKDNDFMK